MRRTRFLVIILIFIVAACLRSQDLRKPWVGHHKAWGGATYGNIARNFIKYGYAKTKFGPVANTGEVPVEKFEFYYHYPPLLLWLVALSYHLFGVHEWSARLVPLLFSLALMGLLYIFALRLFSSRVALWTLIVSAIMPIQNYYGTHVDVYGSVAVFFTLLALYGYARWLETHRSLDLALCNLGIILGCMTAWYTYFLVPLIIVHYYFSCFRPGKSREYRLLSIAASAVAVFALFVLHRHMLVANGGAEVQGTLIEKLLIRTSYGTIVTTSGERAGPAWLLVHHLRDVVILYSLPLIILAVTWWVLFIRDGLRGRLQNRDWLVLMLLGYGLLHNLAFPNLLINHDYLALCYAPGIALAAALFFERSYEYLESIWGRGVRNIAIGVLLAIVLATGVYQTERLYSRDGSSYPYQLQRWGEIIRQHSDKEDVVLTPTNEDSVFKYYAEREMGFEADTAQEVIERSKDKTIGYLFICPIGKADQFKGVLEYLDTKYPRQTEDTLLIYTIRRRGQAS